MKHLNIIKTRLFHKYARKQKFILKKKPTWHPSEMMTYGSLLTTSRIARLVPLTTLTFINPMNSIMPICTSLRVRFYLPIERVKMLLPQKKKMAPVTSNQQNVREYKMIIPMCSFFLAYGHAFSSCCETHKRTHDVVGG